MKTRMSRKERQREQLILALMQQPNFEKAAEAVGISKSTAWRISNTPEFEEEYRKARQACLSQSRARLQHACNAAVSTLIKITLDPEAPAAARVKAANSVLEHSQRGIEVEEFDARISLLEQLHGR